MLSRRVASLDAPWIDRLKARADELRAQGADVISLGQAVPGVPPPPSAIRAARAALDEPAAHLYTSDAGTPELRIEVARWLHELAGGAAQADNLLITAGGNQAFMVAALALLDPGDEVLLASPYFLNHETAVRAVSAVPVEVPVCDDGGFTPAAAAIEQAVSGRTRAVVIVTPSNPTGAVMPADEIRRLARALLEREIALIVDETYLPFVYDDVPFSATALAEYPNVVTVGSFSKVFAMTGWRLGYLSGPRGLIEEALKIQDAMVICAPAISQAAVLGALRTEPRYIDRFLPELRSRREFLRARLAGIPPLRWDGAAGGFFAFVQVRGCTDSISLSTRLLDEAHVVTLPGRLFGRAGEGSLRLSYGAMGTEDIGRALQRIEEFLAMHPPE